MIHREENNEAGPRGRLRPPFPDYGGFEKDPERRRIRPDVISNPEKHIRKRKAPGPGSRHTTQPEYTGEEKEGTLMLKFLNYLKKTYIRKETGAHTGNGFAARMREGASSIIIYFGFCVLAAIACATFVAFAQSYSGTEQAQLISDSASDSAAFAAYEATNGWSMPWKVVKTTTKNVARLNATAYGLTDDSKVVKQGTYTAKADREAAETAKQVLVDTQVNRSDTATFLGDWSAKRNARTEYALAGGMEIVMRAYMFTKQCVEEGSNPLGLPHRTLYAWGGGRGGWNESGTSETMPLYADCSGFVHYIYGMCGYEIGGDTYTMDGQGREVSADEVMPGDIVLFYTGGIATHVGIYVGENSAGRKIMIDCTAGYSGHSRETHINSPDYPSSGSKGVTVRPIYGTSYKFRRLVTDFGEAFDYARNKNNDPAARVFYTLMSLNEDDETVITPKAACALMGNWYQEGGLGKPGVDEPGAMCETRSGDKKYNTRKKAEYDTPGYKADDFANDHYESPSYNSKRQGYGMGQWTSHGRKVNLFNFTTDDMSGHVYSEELQAIFAIKEIKGDYPGVDYNDTREAITSKGKSLKEITDIIYIEYELGGEPTQAWYDWADVKDGTKGTREAAAEYFYNRFVKGEIQMMKNGQDVTKSSIQKPTKAMTDAGKMQDMMYNAHFLYDMTIRMKGGTKRNVKKGEKVLVIKHRSSKDTLQFPDGSIGYSTRNKLYYESQIFDSTFKYKPNVITDFVNKKGYKSKTEWLFFCSKYNQHVYIFKGSKGNWVLQKSMKCGTGNVQNDGGNSRDQAHNEKSYEIYNKGNTTDKYAENLDNPTWRGPRGNQQYNMHYSSRGGNSIHSGSTGHPSTHGCIALSSKNAKWCFNTLPVRTKVIVW